MKRRPIFMLSLAAAAAVSLTAISLGLVERSGELPPAHAAEASAPSLEDLSRIAGHWKGDLDGAPVEEVWLPARNGNMTGALRLFDGEGNLSLLELFTLDEQESGEIIMLVRHFDTALTPWASEADGPLRVRLQDASDERIHFVSDRPEQSLESLIYEFDGEDRMTITVGFGEGREPILLRLTRAP